ncbi:hypothetical protein MSPP1_000142 [Malassezia sp. CBS 17886]|nr:hypothetical protein MSPP1_000142 [Malassezia sp. CBS 17886]
MRLLVGIRSAHTGTRRCALEQLVRIQDMICRVSVTNRPAEKHGVLAEYADLMPVLSRLYLRSQRFFVSAASLQKYMAGPMPTTHGSLPPTPYSLEDLFDILGSRTVTGHAAKHLVAQFIHMHGLAAHASGTPSVLDIFYRCLDRNLKAGISQRTVAQLERPKRDTHRPSALLAQLRATGDVSSFPLEVALAHVGDPNDLDAVAQKSGGGTCTWFSSRKLDGVRCLLVAVVDGADARACVTEIHAVSRTGRALPGLQHLRTQLADDLTQYPGLGALAQQLGGTIVLDGEVCIMDAHGPDGAAHMENYRRTVSCVRRKPDPERPPPLVFFPFDMLSLEELVCWRTLLATRALSARLAPLQSWVAWCAQHRRDSPLRSLPQRAIRSLDDLSAHMAEATQEHWEGLIVRADTAYEGRRTAAMLKLRHTLEAEYTVKDVELKRMRLPVHGTYAEHPALSSVVVEHEGVPVSVGSGFSVAERLRFAASPNEILGKTVTVAYFRESESAQRRGKGGQGGKSLRFPIVKCVFGVAGRDM